jgi:hypothetical protein
MTQTNGVFRERTRQGCFRIALVAFATLATFTLLMTTGSPRAFSAGEDPNAEYDRLDGMGASGKTVNVIEWENNLEIHVAPKGSLKGLSLTLDKPDAQSGGNKLVMVIGYRFGDKPQVQLIRRAILGIPMVSGFKAYVDPTEDDYDKVVISNNGQASPLALYKLETPSKQLYPDGYEQELRGLASVPASKAAPTSGSNSSQADPAAAQQRARAQAVQADREDSGTIKPFFSQ